MRKNQPMKILEERAAVILFTEKFTFLLEPNSQEDKGLSWKDKEEKIPRTLLTQEEIKIPLWVF